MDPICAFQTASHAGGLNLGVSGCHVGAERDEMSEFKEITGCAS